MSETDAPDLSTPVNKCCFQCVLREKLQKAFEIKKKKKLTSLIIICAIVFFLIFAEKCQPVGVLF